MSKKIHQVVHRRLGRELAHGIAHIGKNKMDIDERLSKYRYLLIMLHEHFHLRHPEWSETRVKKESSCTARFLWENNFRWVDIK